MDYLPQEHKVISTSWIEKLAIEEISMEESGVIQFNDHLNSKALVEESSIKMVDAIRERLEIYVAKFNEYRANRGGGIRIFKISNTINDFMLFRNSLKFIVARRNYDRISIGFLSNSGGLFSARLNLDTPAQNQAHELTAHLGPFNKIEWKFNNEPVDIDVLARHYLTEFIKHSAR